MANAGSSSDVTRLLQDWRGGSREALDRLMPLVYTELHTLASRYLARERRERTLQPTALVNEAYLRLAGQSVDWQNRAHFFGIAAQLMRRILVDRAGTITDASEAATWKRCTSTTWTRLRRRWASSSSI